MAVCPICQTEFESALPGRLCDRCAAEVVARDAYQPSDLRFVGVLAGVLGAAILSTPGAFVGYYAGMALDRAWAGSLAGVVVMSMVGLIVGSKIGRSVCQRMDAEKHRESESTLS